MIGIFAGSGDLPKEIVNSLKEKKKSYIILNLSKKKIPNSINIKLGEFGKILKVLKKNNTKEVIFAGKVDRPNLNNTRFDLKGLYYLPELIKIFKQGDGNILKFAEKVLLKNGIKVISSHKYCKNLLVNKTLTKFKPSLIDINDYKKGSKILHALSKFDNAQGIIIDNGYVLSIEAAEGTDNMIKRVKNIYKKKNNKASGVLIKLPKSKQSLKYDLPTIGYNTVKLCIISKIKGIFLKKNQNIFLNQKKTISLANKNNFFISAI